LIGNGKRIDGKVAGCGWVNQDGYGGAFDGVWMVGGEGNVVGWMWTERDGRR
jgi:hypothetical protein